MSIFGDPTNSASRVTAAAGAGTNMVTKPKASSTIVKKAAATNSGRYQATGGVPSGGAPTAPAAPDLNTFLNQDTGYNQQMRDFSNALQQFLADVTRRKGTMESDYNASSKAMGDQKVLDLDNMEDDFGARGMIRSGLYGDAVGKYNTEFDTRSQELGRKKTEAMSSLDQEQGRYQSQQTLQQQAAREAAIRRRAEQYGV